MSRTTQAPRSGFVLAGGKSLRMGANKALLDFGGQTLLARALATATEACGNVTIVGDPATFVNFGPVVCDVFPGCGPLGGIHAALTHSSAVLNLMLAVDMPFVSIGLLNFLITAAEGANAVVSVPRTSKGFQPLCAVYRRDFLSVAEKALRAGNYKIDAAFATVPLRILDEPELSAAGFSEKNFFNVNTPEEYHIAGAESQKPRA